jgi:hypothetical protein
MTTTINNVNYTIVNPTTKKALDIIHSMKWAKQWYEVYKNPSITKQHIRDYWSRELDTINANIVGYTGNTFNFSIYAENDEYYFCITSAHNYAVPKN